MRLLIATTNPAKFAEARDVLESSGFECVGLKDFSGIKSVPETGDTFEKNAVLKAKEYFAQTRTPCIADDGGLEVDYLDGKPGVHSHRWLDRRDAQGLGRKANDRELAEAVLEGLQGVPQEKRTARLGGSIAFWNGENLLLRETWVHGYIAEAILSEIKSGFPYRSIFIIPQFGKPYSELTDEEHEQVNFRRKNLYALKDEIAKILSAR